MAKAFIGIIGGTGVYDSAMIENSEEISVETPFGKPSDTITIGTYMGKEVAFLPRHGKEHKIPPHKINFRANIYALKELGVERILAPQAVGSLQEEYKPGQLAFPDQFIDRTTNRETTFYDGPQVAHISMAEPFCSDLRSILIQGAKNINQEMHETGTYVCIQGPRFSTKAESEVFRQWKAHLIGMTLVPEVTLAREAEICYSSISMVTDYDCWKDYHVSLDDVVKTMKDNQEKVKNLLKEVIPKTGERNCNCRNSLEGALL